jgi:hypothetical protein
MKETYSDTTTLGIGTARTRGSPRCLASDNAGTDQSIMAGATFSFLGRILSWKTAQTLKPDIYTLATW